jgi:ParB family chromosome partitioning protein
VSNASTRPQRRDPLANFFRDQEASGSSELPNARVIDRTRIDPNPYQPRHQTDPAALEELAGSIRKVGILQPIVIRRVGERYQIIAGERRWRAAALADLSEIPCVERQLTDADMEMMALVENIQREDLHPLDEAHAYRRLMERFTLSLREIAGHIHKSHEHVAQRLRLIEIPEIEAAVRNGHLKITVAHEIAQIDDPATRQEMIHQALAGTRLRVKDVRGSRSATKLEGVAEADGLSATGDSPGPTEVSNNLTPADSTEEIRPVS